MKLRYLGTVFSVLALGLTMPACGDDSSDTSDESSDDDEADAGDDAADDKDDSDDADDSDDTDDATDDATDDTDDATDDATDDSSDDTDDATDDATDDSSDDTDDATDDADGGADDEADDEPTDVDGGDTDEADDEPTDVDGGDTETEPTEAGGPVEGDCVPPEAPEEPEAVDCPALEDREVEERSGDISEDETWSCDKIYFLTGYTYVTGNSTLTIEPGVVVMGDPSIDDSIDEETGEVKAPSSGLFVTRGSTLNAIGRQDAPIVFTSSIAEGDREPGKWGGVTLLGRAPINAAGGEDQVEGLDPTEDRGTFGGEDEEYNCGELRYVRVEFAGFKFATDKELNGIGLAGCGSETKLSHVQVHAPSDDGIEIWGGAPKLDHIVISSGRDDGLDWDYGYTGTVQYLVVQQDPGESDNGIEADNNPDDNGAAPRSAPTVFNATFVGGPKLGMTLRRGTWGTIHNSIITGFAGQPIDVRDEETVLGSEEDPALLSVETSIFFDNGEFAPEAVTCEADDDECKADPDYDDDVGFDEEAFFTAASRANQFDADPELGDPKNLTEPDFVPAADSPAADGAAVPPTEAGFDCSGEFIGAFEPGGDDWTAGWTAYPQD